MSRDHLLPHAERSEPVGLRLAHFLAPVIGDGLRDVAVQHLLHRAAEQILFIPAEQARVAQLDVDHERTAQNGFAACDRHGGQPRRQDATQTADAFAVTDFVQQGLQQRTGRRADQYEPVRAAAPDSQIAGGLHTDFRRCSAGETVCRHREIQRLQCLAEGVVRLQIAAADGEIVTAQRYIAKRLERPQLRVQRSDNDLQQPRLLSQQREQCRRIGGAVPALAVVPDIRFGGVRQLENPFAVGFVTADFVCRGAKHGSLCWAEIDVRQLPVAMRQRGGDGVEGAPLLPVQRQQPVAIAVSAAGDRYPPLPRGDARRGVSARAVHHAVLQT